MQVHAAIYIQTSINRPQQKMSRNDQLAEKLSEINNQFNTKHNKYHAASTETLENKLQMIRKKMALCIDKNKDEMRNVLKDASELYANVEKAGRDYEAEAKLQMDRLRDIEDGFTKRLEVQILERKEREAEIITSFESKADMLKKQIQKERKIRESLFAQVTTTLEDDLPAIMSELNEAKLQCDAHEEETVNHCEQLLEESEKYVKEFSQQQEANSSKAFELIRDLTKKIKLQIEQQKVACEATHEDVFAYVEDTCNKLTQ